MDVRAGFDGGRRGIKVTVNSDRRITREGGFHVNDADFYGKRAYFTAGRVVFAERRSFALGVQAGDRVSFIVADGVVQLVNPAIYAMSQLQDAMEGEAERMGFASVDDAMNYVNELRKEERKS